MSIATLPSPPPTPTKTESGSRKGSETAPVDSREGISKRSSSDEGDRSSSSSGRSSKLGAGIREGERGSSGPFVGSSAGSDAGGAQEVLKVPEPLTPFRLHNIIYKCVCVCVCASVYVHVCAYFCG
jgi:hypothetical protein